MITDLSVQQEIEKELQWDAGVNPNHIAVLVKNGEATLAGDVDSYWEKCEAERAAWRVAHVRKVVNHLRVELPFAAERGDDDITLAAMGILEWNCTVPATVEVAVKGSVLTLAGTVGRAYQREEAERAMAGLVGIVLVRVLDLDGQWSDAVLVCLLGAIALAIGHALLRWRAETYGWVTGRLFWGRFD